METILQVLNGEPVPPRELNMSIPRDLETICLDSAALRRILQYFLPRRGLTCQPRATPSLLYLSSELMLVN